MIGSCRRACAGTASFSVPAPAGDKLEQQRDKQRVRIPSGERADRGGRRERGLLRGHDDERRGLAALFPARPGGGRRQSPGSECIADLRSRGPYDLPHLPHLSHTSHTWYPEVYQVYHLRSRGPYDLSSWCPAGLQLEHTKEAPGASLGGWRKAPLCINLPSLLPFLRSNFCSPSFAVPLPLLTFLSTRHPPPDHGH